MTTGISKNSFSLWILILSVVLSWSGSALKAATLTVTDLADSGPGSLRDMIEMASPGDTITFAVIGKITLSSGPCTIAKNLQIVGPGVQNLTLSGRSFVIGSFESPEILVSISDLTIADGQAEIGGGAIWSIADLTLRRCVLTNNLSGMVGGAVQAGGKLTLTDCTISKNTSLRGFAIDMGGELTVERCTISQNVGGGIYKYLSIFSGGMTLTNTTISANSLLGVYDEVSIAAHPTILQNCTIVSNGIAGVRVDIMFEARSSIFAGNGTDIEGSLFSAGFNLIQNTNQCQITGDTNGNLYGKDPMISPLQNNGGPTFTHALLPGSPAIDAGSPSGAPNIDQRGAPRPEDGNGDGISANDIGAYEVHSSVVSSLSDNGPGTLRDAITFARGGDTITFSVEGKIVLTNRFQWSDGILVIDKDLEILGPGSSLLSITGQGRPLFFVSPDISARISDISITGTRLASGIWNDGHLKVEHCIFSGCNGDVWGGAIQNYGDLTLIKCLITNCTSYLGGGGIQSPFGSTSLVLEDSTITHCSSYYSGGGIASWCPLSLNRCRISQNIAGEGIGGGIDGYNQVIVTECTIDGNIATGSIYEPGVGGGICCGTLSMVNSTVTGNSSWGRVGSSGAGISAINASIESCTIVSNTVYNQYEFSGYVPSASVGAGISGSNTVARNTIVAHNTSILFGPAKYEPVASDIFGPVVSMGYNAIGTLSGLTFSGDLTGCIFKTDPRLGPLQYNGGPTPTHALLPSSPLIDAGSSGSLNSDQRGVLRSCDIFGILNVADGADIGAYEYCPQFVAVEAESGTLTSPMAVSSDALAVQGHYISSAVNGAGSASYDITIPIAGTYVIWCRVNSATFNSDSFFVSADGGPELIYDTAENIQTNAWQWTRVTGRATGAPVNLKPRLFTFAAGPHRLVFRARDPNTKLDRLLVTSDINFVPSISMEAEQGVISSPLAIFSDSAASHGQYVSSPVPEAGLVSFTFGIPATNQYFVWCRVFATNANSDSFYVSMDGGPELIYDVAEGVWTNLWQWTRLTGRTNGAPVDPTPRVFNLGQAKHTLVFRAREANSKLDRVLITDDPNFDPARDFKPSASDQLAMGTANTDLTIWLSETSASHDQTSFRILTAPGTGQLFQYAEGRRGPLISKNDVVTDQSGRVIFSPAPNTCGLSYASFQFMMEDGIRDSVSPNTLVQIFAPPVDISNWTTDPSGARFLFTGIPQTTYSVLATPHVQGLPWINIGSAREISPGVYDFVDTKHTNAQRFFQVTWP